MRGSRGPLFDPSVKRQKNLTEPIQSKRAKITDILLSVKRQKKLTLKTAKKEGFPPTYNPLQATLFKQPATSNFKMEPSTTEGSKRLQETFLYDPSGQMLSGRFGVFEGASASSSASEPKQDACQLVKFCEFAADLTQKLFYISRGAETLYLCRKTRLFHSTEPSVTFEVIRPLTAEESAYLYARGEVPHAFYTWSLLESDAPTPGSS